MILLEDSRQQPGKHKNIAAYCKQQGIEIIRTKLLVGDYMLAGPEIGENGGISGGISCDSKSGVPELAMDIFQQHDRFRRECETAQRCGIKLIILTEEVLPEGRLDLWKSPLDRFGNPRCKFDPAILRKAMITMQEKYDVRFRFVDGRSTGKVLIEFLKGERK